MLIFALTVLGLVPWLAACQPAAVAAPPAAFTVTGSAEDDTAELQAAIDAAAREGGTVEIPPGTYQVSGLRGARNVSLVGAGRESTILEGNDILTISGTEQVSYLEVDYASTIEDIGFEGTGTGVRFEGVAYFAVERLSFSGFDVGLEFAGALQGRVDDTKFLDNRTGLRLAPFDPAYFEALPELPPNRVLVEWSVFYYSDWRAIDYAGGQQLIVRDSEFGDNGTVGDDTSAAIWVEGAGDPGGFGLVASGLWMEHNHGFAAVRLSGPVAHVIRDSWFAYTDATWSIWSDGELDCENVRHDALHTVSAVQGC